MFYFGMTRVTMPSEGKLFFSPKVTVRVVVTPTYEVVGLNDPKKEN